MDNNSRLKQLFSDLFGVSVADLDDKSSPATISAWDSMGMVNLVVELEANFEIALELDEIIGLKCLGDVRRVLNEKGIEFESVHS